MLTWAQIGLHAKPLFLLDIDGYWQPLITLLDHIVAEGFADPSVRGLFTAHPDLDSLDRALQAALA